MIHTNSVAASELHISISCTAISRNSSLLRFKKRADGTANAHLLDILKNLIIIFVDVGVVYEQLVFSPELKLEIGFKSTKS